MAINSIGYGSTVLGQSVRNLNDQLTTLSAQLTTGKKATTYAGMGVNEGFAIAARAQLSNISAFTDTMTKITTTINVTNTALQALANIGGQVQNAAGASSQALNSAGQTIAQQNALAQLGSMLGILNTQSGDRYVFSGGAIDTPSVTDADTLLNGSGAQAGLKQVIAERNQADLGGGLGRLVLSAPATTPITLREDVAPSVFGLKLNSVSSSLTGATVTGPTGSPPTVSIALRHQSKQWRPDQPEVQSARWQHRDHPADRVERRTDAGGQLCDRRHAGGDVGQSERRAEQRGRHARQHRAGGGLRGRRGQQLLRRSAATRREHAACDRNRAHQRHGGEYGGLVHRREWRGLGAGIVDRADRPVRHRSIRRARHRAGDTKPAAVGRGARRGHLDGPERSGAGRSAKPARHAKPHRAAGAADHPGHPGGFFHRAEHDEGRHRPAEADPGHAAEHRGPGRERLARSGREPDPGAADRAAGLVPDHRDAVATEPDQVPAAVM